MLGDLRYSSAEMMTPWPSRTSLWSWCLSAPSLERWTGSERAAPTLSSWLQMLYHPWSGQIQVWWHDSERKSRLQMEDMSFGLFPAFCIRRDCVLQVIRDRWCHGGGRLMCLFHPLIQRPESPSVCQRERPGPARPNRCTMVELRCFFDLQEKIEQFMEEKGKPVLKFHSTEWMQDLAFLVDIRNQLNNLSVIL